MTDEKLQRVIAIANQKGGVAKTTTAVNLATAFAACGFRTLVIDLDPQANATSGLGLRMHDTMKSLYDVFFGDADLKEIICRTQVPLLDLAPARADLASVAFEQSNNGDAAEILKNALAQVKQDYDFILIDCQPSLSLLPVNALIAADALLIPLQTEYYAMEGLSRMLEFLKDLQRSKNKNLKLFGVLLTMVERTNLSTQVSQDVRGYLGDKVFKTEIPRNVKLAEAPSFGKPVILYDRNATGAKAYLSLAAEILKREGLTPKSAAA